MATSINLNNQAPWYLEPNDCIGDSLGYLNQNAAYTTTLATSASVANVVSLFTSSGSVLEQLSNPCDGSTVVGRSGTYTWPSVVAAQVMTSSYVDVSGSSISYTPPTGTTKVIYRFNYTFNGDGDGIVHHKFYVNGTESTYSRYTLRCGPSGELRTTFEWSVGIGGTPNTNTGRIASWTTPKILKLQARYYSTTYPGVLHVTRTWDGISSQQFSMPNLTITAIA